MGAELGRWILKTWSNPPRGRILHTNCYIGPEGNTYPMSAVTGPEGTEEYVCWRCGEQVPKELLDVCLLGGIKLLPIRGEGPTYRKLP
jgi:hypothetical protein